MKLTKIIVLILAFTALTLGIVAFTQRKSKQDTIILSHQVDLRKQNLKLYWKTAQGENIKNFQKLKSYVQAKSEELVFAMNGGMYLKDYSPQGLYIENGILLKQLDTVQEAYGNFYMQPNGIFYITQNNTGFVCQTSEFNNDNTIKYATQSGPMLVINGNIHPKFKKGSSYLNIRNGVGVLPNGNLIFAMSKQKVNLYDFALYFKSLGCKNALYLDGFISKTYLPKKGWKSTDGNFGVIIAETTKK